MKKTETSALDLLKRRYIGDDKKRLAALDRERVNAEVASLIHNARRRAGLNQKQLAEKVGTTQSVISRLEDADYGGHSLNMLKRVSSALGQKVEVLFVDGR
ncbi:MAG TPA: helix-turn-helix domain-containing protein, partial [Phycisphaerae bacterium]|nr:helix-turn-helix domain-containing protein [Phycisphaerae bacterium]